MKAHKVGFLVTIFLFGLFNICKAGFGISPPYVFNDKLLPGSHHEQRITLVRSKDDINTPAKIQISIDAPEIREWIKIDKGEEFIFPVGKNYIYMTISVDVPKDATFGKYSGSITANLIEEKGEVTGGAAVALGALIDIDLTVGADAISDLSIYSLRIPDFSETDMMSLWVGIDNKGNSYDSPSKVTVDISSITDDTIISSIEFNNIPKVESFTKKEVETSVPHNLAKGSYWATTKVYKDGNIIWQDKIFTTVLEGVEEITSEETEGQKVFNIGSVDKIIETINNNLVLIIILIVLVLVLVGIIITNRK